MLPTIIFKPLYQFVVAFHEQFPCNTTRHTALHFLVTILTLPMSGNHLLASSIYSHTLLTFGNHFSASLTMHFDAMIEFCCIFTMKIKWACDDTRIIEMLFNCFFFARFLKNGSLQVADNSVVVTWLTISRSIINNINSP